MTVPAHPLPNRSVPQKPVSSAVRCKPGKRAWRGYSFFDLRTTSMTFHRVGLFLIAFGIMLGSENALACGVV